MLVYGDSRTTETAGSKRAKVEAALAAVEGRPPGLGRHAALVSAFIEASELVQGLADAVFEMRGCDGRSAEVDAGTGFLVELAHALDQSWSGGFHGDLSLPTHLALQSIRAGTMLSIRKAEGYAFYALYPEAYLEAARRSGLQCHTRVIGVRSIGLGLAALVAAALGAPEPVSVRPVGHPFRRELRVGDEVAAQIVEGGFASFAIVDEGPGLSGSSFGAVSDWLQAQGVRHEQIHFFPSHPGLPGPQASPAHRERWERSSRHVVEFDDLLMDDGERGLRAWVADLVGPIEGPLEDVSGGQWRRRRYRQEQSWPGANTQQERRKFLARAGGSDWLVKFAGLGGDGEAKLRVARFLHQSGFGPETVGLRHGFLVQRWLGQAPSLDQTSFERERLVGRLGDYLGFRARELPAVNDGAPLSDLRSMALHNTGQALGAPIAEALDRRLPAGDELQAKVRRVGTDNRMHAHEWLVVGGELIKADGLDHNSGHDLVGCQDVSWDVAGAVVEFGLTQREVELLCARVGQTSGHAVDTDLLAFLIPCYLAFQMGACALARSSVEPREARRLDAAIERYGARLSALLRKGPVAAA